MFILNLSYSKVPLFNESLSINSKTLTSESLFICPFLIIILFAFAFLLPSGEVLIIWKSRNNNVTFLYLNS